MWSLQIFDFELYFLFYNFFLYSFFGWIYESCLVSFQEKTWVNRGFLNGPILPIYGGGATIVYVCLSKAEQRPVMIFLLGMTIATVLEYVTSYVMEKLFHMKWWDYTHYKYQIKGRICLVASLFWGFLSLLMMDVLQPLMNSLIARIPRQAGEIAGYFIFVAFAGDLVVTVIYTMQLDKRLTELARYREEFLEYMESTRLYETGEELREKMKQLPVYSMGEAIRERLDEGLREKMEEQQEKREEIIERFHGFRQKYESRAKLQNIVEQRLIKAFPTMKSIHNESIIKELRKRNRAEKNDRKA